MHPRYASLDFETVAHALVGRLVFEYSRLDVNLALHLASFGLVEDYGIRLKRLDQSSFREKLEHLRRIIGELPRTSTTLVHQWETWFVQANDLRERRNALVHGRWGIVELQGFVSNVSGLPGTDRTKEVRYSLPELEAEVLQAERVSTDFWNLARRGQ